MARPKKDKVYELKLLQVNVRYTIPDYNRLSDEAQESGMKMTDYIRTLTLNRVTPKPKLKAINKDLLIELTRQGTNLNQLAKKANVGIKKDAELKSTFSNLSELLNEVKLILINNGS